MVEPLKTGRSISRRSVFFPEEAKIAGVQISRGCLAFQGVACRACDDACEVRAIRFRPQLGGNLEPLIDAEACTACGDCLSVCPVSALSLSGDPKNA